MARPKSLYHEFHPLQIPVAIGLVFLLPLIFIAIWVYTVFPGSCVECGEKAPRNPLRRWRFQNEHYEKHHSGRNIFTEV